MERRAAFSRAVAEAGVYVLPARFDDSELPGLLPDVVTIDLRRYTPAQFADLIVEKLASLAASPSPPGGTDRSPAGAVRVEKADPRRLGVHAAISVPGAPDEIPPEYVPRDVDAAESGARAKVAAAAARGGFVLLVGASSVGKTRCAAEAVKALLPDWWLVHPAGPDQLAALAAAPFPRTVVWLDELQDYLDGEHGLSGAVMRALLNHGAVIIGTLWPDRYAAYTVRAPGGADLHARERQVLDLADVVRIAPAFSPAEQDRARAAAAGDPRLAVALEAAGYGLTQTLAAAPQLVSRWEDAQTASPYAWAVLTAALDVARLGARAPLSAEFLRAAAVDYCTSSQQAEAPDDWFEQALAYGTTKLRGAAAALSPAGAGMGQIIGYAASDYLVQHATRERRYASVPASTWDAALSHIRDLDDTARLAWEASFAGRLEHVEKAFERALAEKEYTVAAELASCLGDAGREERAIQLLETTIAAAGASQAVPAADLLDMRRMLAWQVGDKAGGHGDPKRAEEIARRVVRESTTVYGPAHRKTLDARIELARQVGAAGNPRQALTIAQEAESAAIAALGVDDLTTLSARFEVAVWTSVVDGAAASAERFTELIQQAKRLDPPPRVLIADIMANLADRLSDAGDHAQAVQVSGDAISLGQQLWGANHARVLWMRLGQAHVVGSSGDPQTAVDLSGRLADDCAEILGGTHLTTLQAMHAVAHWGAAAGDHQAAAQRYDALLADLARILGDDHWLTQQCRTELTEIKKV
jgi:tetratricopeptide (TPR) repeat protein